MTERQALVAHIEAHHRRIRVGHRSKAEMAKDHAREHHQRGGLDHYHAGLNLGPTQRPAGWYSGADAVLR